MTRTRPPAERFWPKVHKDGAIPLDCPELGQCWEWTARKIKGGYGRFTLVTNRQVLAHRFAWELENGPIAPGMTIDHRCHNTGCVNPRHLRMVTNKQNCENKQGKQRNNTSGFLGVTLDKGSNRWRAQVRHNRKLYNAGSHSTREAAAEAATALRLQLFTHNEIDRRAAA